MKFDVLTLFPEMFEPLNSSIIGRAIEKNLIQINLINIRDFSKDKHKKVDDTPYGGGAGMVMRVDIVYDAIESVRTPDSKVYLMSPAGKVFNQGIAKELSSFKHLILVCGHYEGIDDRITNFIDGEISIGDYILTGGELASMVITDAVTRLVDGVITKESLDDESFNDDLLDYPTYTRPFEFKGYKVPDVLISGHHENINKWRMEERIKRTEERRPDLKDNK
jgi:tRNA (guanine37-N1)-methyltransferase